MGPVVQSYIWIKQASWFRKGSLSLLADGSPMGVSNNSPLFWIKKKSLIERGTLDLSDCPAENGKNRSINASYRPGLEAFTSTWDIICGVVCATYEICSTLPYLTAIYVHTSTYYFWSCVNIRASRTRGGKGPPDQPLWRNCNLKLLESLLSCLKKVVWSGMSASITPQLLLNRATRRTNTNHNLHVVASGPTKGA